MKIRTKLLFLTAVMAARAALPNTIPISSTADDGACTLRAALADATDGDIIDASGVTGTILLTSGELFVAHSVAIVGPGADKLAVDGNHNSRVFHVGSDATVSISGLTITNGNVGEFDLGAGVYNDHAVLQISDSVIRGNNGTNYGAGGGIFNNGVDGSATLSVSNCTISDNHAGASGGGIMNNGFDGHAVLTITKSRLQNNDAANGGGIYNAGESDIYYSGVNGMAILTIVDSTVSGNVAELTGGGILNDGIFTGNAIATITGSTISGNFASWQGGGILNDGESGSVTLSISNSTVSGNSTLGFQNIDGGGILNDGSGGVATATIVNSTLSGNSATNGGGIFNRGPFGGSAIVRIGSTILNAGLQGANITNDSGRIITLGYNLGSDNCGGFLIFADQINTNPMLGPLQDNGGPTWTHALLCGSPAIDQGRNFSGSTTDQRGLPRLVDDPSTVNAAGGDGTDVGAFEVQPGDCGGPAQKISDLIALVQNLGLPAGTANSLTAKLQAAVDALNRGTTPAACGSLQAFVNEVNAQNGKKLTAAQAGLLLTDAARIQTLLNCSR